MPIIDPEKMSEAHRWLDKAVAFEADETKTEKMVELAFTKALKLEREALGLDADTAKAA